MRRGDLDRTAARLAIVELRALLAADAMIPLRRRRALVRRSVGIEPSELRRETLEHTLNWLIARRLARNPDNSEIAPTVRAALRLLDALQDTLG